MIYIHKSTGDKYIKFYDALLRDPGKDEWVQCVIFVPRSDPTDKRVCWKFEFEATFRPLLIGDNDD